MATRNKSNWFDRLNLSIIGAIVGIALSVMLTIISDTQTILAVTVGLVTTIAFMQLDELIQQNKTDEIAGILFKMRNDRELQARMEELVNNYLEVKKLDDILFLEKANTKLRTFADELAILAEGRFYVDVSEENYLITFLPRGKRSIRISSWLDTVEYWNSPEGKAYVQEMSKMISENKIKIIRIFILKRSELDLYKEIINAQESAGIEIRIAFEDGLPSELIEAYVLYDDKSVRTETLIRGYQKNAVLSIRKSDINLYMKKFSELQIRSRPFKELLTSIPNESSSASD